MIKNAIWLFCFAIGLLAVFIPSYTRMQDLQQKNTDYEAQIKELESKNVRLEREQKLLKDDPEYLEKVAREKMGLIREGEVIFQITTNQTQP